MSSSSCCWVKWFVIYDIYLSAVGLHSAYPSVDYFYLFRVCWVAWGPPDAVFSSLSSRFSLSVVNRLFYESFARYAI